MNTRRAFLMRAGMTALAGTLPMCPTGLSALSPDPDYRLGIGPCTFEIAHNKFLKTVAYNGLVPGPTLQLKQGRAVTIDVTNRTSRPEVVHWHGLDLPSVIDGAMEEGTPMVAPGATSRVTFTPKQGGLRWYHTHTMAGGNLGIGQYSGLHGLMLIEANDPLPQHDKEFTLVLHDWDGQFAGSDDGTMQPTYNYSTINGKTESFSEPLRVKHGERVLFQILNASATDVHWLSFSGHRFHIIAMDGNPLSNPRSVSMLRLAPAERITAMVTMDAPGVWVLAEPRKHVRAAGMGIVVEYSGSSGSPQYDQPNDLEWHYSDFLEPVPDEAVAQASIHTIPLVIESKFRGHGSPEQWLLNGYSYPQPNTPVLKAGQRYRLRFDNRSMDDHPLHLHRHLFRIASIAGKPLQGPLKDTVLVESKTVVEVDFTADNPGPSLLHCHQQDHMDRGFMMVFRYA